MQNSGKHCCISYSHFIFFNAFLYKCKGLKLYVGFFCGFFVFFFANGLISKISTQCQIKLTEVICEKSTRPQQFNGNFLKKWLAATSLSLLASSGVGCLCKHCGTPAPFECCQWAGLSWPQRKEILRTNPLVRLLKGSHTSNNRASY